MNHSVQVVDLLQYTPLGGVLYWDVFHLPPQAHQVNGWEIRQVNRQWFECLLLTSGQAVKASHTVSFKFMLVQLLETGLQAFPYPTDEKEEPTSPPISVSLTLPDSAVFLETPQVARWDVAGRADSYTLCNISLGMMKIF